MKSPKQITLILFLFFLSFSNAQSWETLYYNDAIPGLEVNPVKGIIPGFSGKRNFPYSMEFYYIGLRNTMMGINNFNWTELEDKLEAISDKGNTAIIRFYLDTPGKEIATPQFLIDQGVEMRSYSNYGNEPGDSLSPDYNDPRTMEALINFIENLGLKYNNDPRVSIIQGGLVGFWGEWHNYPLVDELGMAANNKKIIFEKFIEAFPDTHVNIREPQTGVAASSELKVGYHDDSFAESTIGPKQWNFWPKIETNGVSQVWKNHPIGGEIYPPHSDKFWNDIPNTVGQDFEDCVNTTHATYLLNQSIFSEIEGSVAHNNALEQNKLLGYKFYANAVKLYPFKNGTINFDVRIENKGVAPFYYDWKVEFALANQNRDIINLGDTTWGINKIIPDNEVVRNYEVPLNIETGIYTLLMRVVNPLEAIKSNAKQLRFANEEQDADLNGWLSLKSFNYDALVANENNTEKFVIYPNPTSNSFTVKLTEENISAKGVLIDVLGKNILSFSTKEDTKIEVAINDMNSGVYFVRITSEEGKQSVKRLIVK